MSDSVIKVENLSKLYRIGQNQTGKDDLRHAIENAVRHPIKWLRDRQRTLHGINEFWALKDVSFQVNQGDVVGIIGRNGAGKSTLLKILSRITEPTSGRIAIKGRVASLLEVGTGFHGELTGRENIFLNGAILGMTRIEIKNKFDQIVEFSGVEKFLDTPVKRYSSGMYVRLAFAVAAHLQPEIMIVDEVLAVGDTEFQQKCLGKMRDVAGHGRTVLFVSHNLSAIRSLCSSSIWLDRGSVCGVGPTSEILDNYLRSSATNLDSAEVVLPEDLQKPFQVVKARVTRLDGQPCSRFVCDEEISLELLCHVRQQVPGLYGYLQISRRDGIAVLESDSVDTGKNSIDGLSPGLHTVKLKLPARSLGPGDYVAYFNFESRTGSSQSNVDFVGDILCFRIDDPISPRGNNRGGFFGTLLEWEVSPGSLTSDIELTTSN